MTRITISLRDPEKTALRALSEIEFRDPRQQAALIIRQELQRRGLLDVQSESSPAHVDPSPLAVQTATKRKRKHPMDTEYPSGNPSIPQT
jgi:hypothetical protein